MKLLVSFLSGLLSLTVMGGQVTPFLIESQALRSLENIEYREYEDEDNLTLVQNPDAPVDCEISRCWVAVPSGSKTVVGLLVMAIPKPSVPADVKKAIAKKRPSGCKKPGGAIGIIYELLVANLWKDEGIEGRLLSGMFQDLPRVKPNWDVVYTQLKPVDHAQIALYEKLKFMQILDEGGGALLVYARYNA